MKKLISLTQKESFYFLLIILTGIVITVGGPAVYAQSNETVEGAISDAQSGETLPGVNILVKGTTMGTSSDEDGNYQLTVESLQDTLVVSFVGYQTQQVSINGRTEIDINLQPQAITGEEMVVVGYGTQKKTNLTGSVDQIDSKSIENFSVSNVSRALQGQIPGLNINFNNGRPNSSPEYNIRGLTSIGAGGSALVLIDGVEGDPSTLNPKDIESVSVLKDAASAAIYGSRGAFGVVLITTKNPGEETRLEYSANFSANYKTTQRDVVTDSYIFSKLYMESFTELYGGTRTPTTVGSSGLSFSQEYLDELKYRHENPDHGRPEVEVDPQTGEYMYYGNTDWRNLILADNIPSMEHSLTASGGDDQASYYISGRYFTQDGLFKIRSDNYNAYDLRTKGSIKPMKWLNINANLHYSSNSYVTPFGSTNVWNEIYVRSATVPMGVPYNPDETYSEIGSKTIGRLESENQSKTQEGSIRASVNFDASIVENAINLKGDFTYKNRIIKNMRKFITVPYSNAPGEITDLDNSRLYNNENTLDYYTSNLYGDFSRNFGKHTLDVLGGANIEISNTRYLNVNRDNLLVKNLDVLNAAGGDNMNISGGGSDWKNLGFFSRIKYSFKERYLLEINARYDGSSKFPEYERFGFFPSLSIGWRLSEEAFLKNTENWLDNLKLRGSYGSLGNSRIDPYIFISTIEARKSSTVIQGEKPVVITNPAVLPDNLTWETATTFDVGLDIDLFQNRLGVVFDWYRRTTTNMITGGPILPATFGAAEPKGNYADLKTEGFELSLKWRDQINTAEPINYGIQITLADDRSYITKFNNQGNLNFDSNYRNPEYYEGMRVGEIWGLTTLGLFVDQEDINNHADQSFIMTNVAGKPAKPGDIKFKDLNDDGIINWGDRTLQNPGDLSVIGNSSPRYKFGIRLNGQYSNFSILAFFQGVGKKDWYPAHHQNPFWGPYGYWGAELPKHFLGNAYTKDNPDPNAYWPRWKGNMAYGRRQLQPQTRYMQNTAYIRLKELNISYSLKPDIAERLGMKNIQVSFTGYNIWTYSPIYKITRGIDPEQMGDFKGTNYPMLKSYSLGVSMNF